MASTETRIRCGHCKASHSTIEQVRSCATTLTTRPAKRHESFGDTMRRIDAERAAKAATTKLVARTEAIAAKPRKVRPADLYKGDETGPCRRCAMTGQFITGTMNGVPVGPGGICFNCAGKGRLTDCGEAAHAGRAQAIADGERTTEACCDRVRNDLYWTYGFKVNCIGWAM